MAPFQYLIPARAWRDFFTRRYRQIPGAWNFVSDAVLANLTKLKIRIQQNASVSKLQSYIVLANHQTWADIMIVQRAIGRIASPSVYMMKRELVWFPFLGQGCYLLGFPMMRRFSKAYLEKHPKKRGLDVKSTRKSCERYRRFPVSLVSFIEGTRYTQEKHDRQGSPYRHLLKPRAGGLAHALSAMGDQVKAFLDVTVVYQGGRSSIWELFTGKAREVCVNIDLRPIADFLRGDYDNDKHYREVFQRWVNELWSEKDRLIGEISARLNQTPV
ncbi:MAG: acyltransferase [Gammaproteobacteria bacterium CG12_big_fil_rev_8_21_14_0_65_46_12]|nr:MAG: acyltransferase [Gammaproteobacteria bacterium CG12_big_fil_rev_8_21_14_0_65_46_12]